MAFTSIPGNPATYTVFGAGSVNVGARQARSGVVVAGVTYADWVPPSFTVRVNDVLRTTYGLKDTFTIEQRLGSPSTCRITVIGMEPAVGQSIVITHATPDRYLFVGRVLTRTAHIDRAANRVYWQCSCVDESWLLDRYALVTKRYTNQGVNTIVADILANFTDGGFVPGEIPSSLGNLTMDFSFETVSSALGRVAKAVQAYVRLGPTNHVSLSTTYTDGNPITLTDATTGAWALEVTEDLLQVTTRIYIEGEGSTTTTRVEPNSTTIPVQDIRAFSPTGGLVRAGVDVLTYTGVSLVSPGVGSLTGVTGMTRPINMNDRVSVIVQVDDATKQTALAALLGGGVSGIAVQYLQGASRSFTEATARANAELALHGQAIPTVAYTTTNRFVEPGKLTTASVTLPITISGAFRIQSIVITPRTQVEGTTVGLQYRLTASPYDRRVEDFLRQGGPA